jgi:hypothetical protein
MRCAAVASVAAQVGDVVLLDASKETGARNERRIVAALCARDGTFELIHGLLNRVMEVLGVPLAGACLAGGASCMGVLGVPLAGACQAGARPAWRCWACRWQVRAWLGARPAWGGARRAAGR